MGRMRGGAMGRGINGADLQDNESNLHAGVGHRRKKHGNDDIMQRGPLGSKADL